jgi:phosphate acetyltransferase
MDYKVKRPRAILPEVHLHDRGARYRQLIALTRGLAPIRTAVAHPVDRNALLAVDEVARAGLIVPSLVGPAARIQATAVEASVDVSMYCLIPTEHSDESIARAIALLLAHHKRAAKPL